MMRASTLLSIWFALLATAACQRGAHEQSTASSATPTAPSASTPPSAAASESAKAPVKPATRLKLSIPAPPDVAAPPADAEKTASGLAMKVLSAGTGTAHPRATDYASVEYTGWTRDGVAFEASQGNPRRFDLAGVIPGWNEALTKMVVGEKRRIWVPKELGFANLPRIIGPPKDDLTYDIELIEIIPSPVVPVDVKAPPRTAKRTSSGLAYRVLSPGQGKVHPTKGSRAEVSFAAWTPEGRLFETSLLGGGSMSVKLEKLIPGWSEGLQLMVEGETMRLWIPGKLAYGEIVKGRKELPFMKPSGPVVYDVTLFKILE
jgi:peptidylprolyl isomerase